MVTLCSLLRYITTNAIQITIVVYIVKPINLASLKFSGTFLVLNAYKVHIAMRKKSNPSGAVFFRSRYRWFKRGEFCSFDGP